MAKPRKSTFDAHVDQFADFDIETQERVIEMCEFVHRQAKRRRPRRDDDAIEARAAATATGQQSLTGLPDEDQK